MTVVQFIRDGGAKLRASGAHAMADENSVIVTADPFKVDPFMRIDFEDGKVNRITIGNRWIWFS